MSAISFAYYGRLEESHIKSWASNAISDIKLTAQLATQIDYRDDETLHTLPSTIRGADVSAIEAATGLTADDTAGGSKYLAESLESNKPASLDLIHEVNPEDGTMTNYDADIVPGIYQGGCADLFER